MHHATAADANLNLVPLRAANKSGGTMPVVISKSTIGESSGRLESWRRGRPAWDLCPVSLWRSWKSGM